MSQAIRLNKFIAESGLCSRREADRFIEKGMVRINGQLAKSGDLVNHRDRVLVNGMEIEVKSKEDARYILFNKPIGITTTTDATDKSNIIDYIRYGERIFPVGRLDKDSTGLIILTSNGDIVNQILRAGNDHEKEYLVTVDKKISQDFVEKMAAGVPILGQITKKCAVELVNPTTFRITLIQGLNRQIRRMCEYFGYEVVHLERTRIMHLELKGIAVGEYREMTPSELDQLFEELEDSRQESAKSLRNDAKAKTQQEAQKNQGEAKRNALRKSEGRINKEAADEEYAAILREARMKERNRGHKKGPKTTQSTGAANAQRSAKNVGKKVGGKAAFKGKKK